MIWSKVKKQFESLLAEPLQGRLSIHVTEYTHKNQFDVGRGWITLDGNEVVSVLVPSFYSDNFHFRTETLDFGKAVYMYPSLSINEARRSTDELISGLVFLDQRFGKRSLKQVEPSTLHPFSKALFRVRCEAEEAEEVED